MKNLLQIVTLFLIAGFFTACEQTEVITPETEFNSAVQTKGQTPVKNSITYSSSKADDPIDHQVITPADLAVTFGSTTLVAGQNYNAGTVITGISTDPITHEHYLTIFVDVTNTGWATGTTHIFVGGSGSGVTPIVTGGGGSGTGGGGAGTGGNGNGNGNGGNGNGNGNGGNGGAGGGAGTGGVGGVIGLPVNGGGNPSPGQFPFGSGDISLNTVLNEINSGTYNPVGVYQIPLGDVLDPSTGDVCFVMMVHAETYELSGTAGDPSNPVTSIGSQTAWADGSEVTDITGGNGGWATYVEYCL